MAIEEQVIQSDSVNPAEQPVAETASKPTQPQAPNLDSVKAEYENQLSALRKQVCQIVKKNLKVSRLNLMMFTNKKINNVNRN